MRVNLKELIEQLEKIVLIGDYHYYPITDGTETIFRRKVEVDLSTLENAIMELKQLENIYQQ